MMGMQTVWLLVLAGLSGFFPALQSAPQPDVKLGFSGTAAVPVSALPVRDEAAIAPVIQAKAALLIDIPSQQVLFSQNAEAPLPIASLTKLMTALLVVDSLEPGAVVTIPPLATGPDESQAGLLPGQRYPAEELLAVMLVASANDASRVLAATVAGNETTFVRRMNERARTLGMSNTSFSNSSGYDQGENYASARDLALLARATLAEPRIRAQVARQEVTIKPLEGEPVTLRTTDELLGGYLPIAGLKTGTTEEAGPCLISVVEAGPKRLLAIVLNSPDRFQENKSMLDWGLRSHSY